MSSRGFFGLFGDKVLPTIIGTATSLEYKLISVSDIQYAVVIIRATDTINLSKNMIADILLVGGGGGLGFSGAYYPSGGGGAEVISVSNVILSKEKISIIIGAGSVSAWSGNASAGGASYFGSILTARGGGGGYANGNGGASGNTLYTGGAPSGSFSGGGAGDSQNGSGGASGAGGNGTSSTITGVTAYYGGGGSGSRDWVDIPRGSGLGSDGINTGGGGTMTGRGGNGRNGIAIIRYLYEVSK